MAAISIAGGAFCGFVAGAAARYGSLCSYGAIEDVLVASDWRRMRAWALALAIAITFTSIFAFYGWVQPSSLYSSPRLEIVPGLVGGLLFGLGMSLVGTCGFGGLVRLGGGDLRCLPMVAVLGIAAYATANGVLAPVRALATSIGVLSLDHPANLSIQIRQRLGDPFVLPIALAIATAISAFVFAAGDLKDRPKLVIGGIVFGLAIAAGWLISSYAGADAFSLASAESLSFVAPLGRTILYIMASSSLALDFGVASVFGVVLGSACVAIINRQWRWEAFDDHREMRRYLFGAGLMGVGGMLARGCTIGQGLTAGSVLAFSMPIALGGMTMGSAIGLILMLEGRSGLGDRLKAIFLRAGPTN